jgi:hypothetical protein
VARRAPLGPTFALLLVVLGAGAAALWAAGWRPANNAVVPDLAAYLAPKYRYAAERVAGRELPLWNPHEFCGLPFLATIQPAVLYPPLRVLYAIFPPAVAYTAFFVVHLVLAACFTAMLARQLGAGRWPSILAAGWVIHPLFLTRAYNQAGFLSGLTWVPVLLLLLRRVVAQPSSRDAAMLGMIAAVQVTSGYPPLVLATAYLLLLSLPFWLADAARPVAALRASAIALAVSLVTAVLLASAQVLPAIDFVASTDRMSAVAAFDASLTGAGVDALLTDLGAAQRTWTEAAHVAWRQFGPVPIAAGLIGLVAWPTAAGCYLLAAALACTLVPMPMLRALPFAGFVRLFFEWPIAAPLFVYGWAALGLEGIARRLPFARPWLPVAAVMVLAMTMAWNFPVAAREWKIPNPWPDRELPDAVIVGCDLGAGRSRVLWPQGHFNGAVITQRLDSIAGYESSLPPSRAGKLLRALKIDVPPMWAGWPPYVARHAGLLARMGVRCIVVPQSTAVLAQRFALVHDQPPDVVYRVDPLLPRARAVFAAVAVATPDAALEMLLDETVDPRAAVILEGSPEPPLATCPPADRARVTTRIESYRPEEVRVRTEGSCERWIVLADSNDPGWVATVDERPAAIHQADYAFRAVRVPGGTHELVFRYRPGGIRIGIPLSLVGMLAVGGLAALPTARDPLRTMAN